MAYSTGIDRRTGRVLTDFDHVIQSLEVLLTTHLGSRVMRRVYGAEVPRLLGNNIVPSTPLRFATAIHVAVGLWEPRFALKQVTFPQTTPEGIRAGRLGIALYGQYRPRGHLGDPTPEGGDRLALF